MQVEVVSLKCTKFTEQRYVAVATAAATAPSRRLPGTGAAAAGCAERRAAAAPSCPAIGPQAGSMMYRPQSVCRAEIPHTSPSTPPAPTPHLADTGELALAAAAATATATADGLPPGSGLDAGDGMPLAFFAAVCRPAPATSSLRHTAAVTRGRGGG